MARNGGQKQSPAGAAMETDPRGQARLGVWEDHTKSLAGKVAERGET